VSRGSGPLAVGTVAAYAAAIVAFGYALVSLYWAVGGRGLAGTVGGYVQQMARRGGGAVVLLAVVAVAAKAVAGLIALALARPWGGSFGARGCWSFRPRPACCSSGTAVSAWPPVPWSCRVSCTLRGAWTGSPCAGMGPVVLGVGDLAGGGNRQLLAAEHQPPRRVIAQVTESTSGLNPRRHSTAAHGASGRAGSCRRWPGRSPAICNRSPLTTTQTQPIHAEPAIDMGRRRINRNHVE
jgi:hypothetical protein